MCVLWQACGDQNNVVELALTPFTLMCVGPETQTGHQAYMGKWHYQLSHLSGPIHFVFKRYIAFNYVHECVLEWSLCT